MGIDKYRRKPPAMDVRNKVFIMCGGETVEIYFNQYKNKHKRDLQNINIKVVAHKKSNPMAVVKAAITQKTVYDEVWAVFDKDDFTDFDDAIVLALNNGIDCAFSNEAIEYWFILHFDNKTGAMSRNALKSELEKKLGFEYGKDSASILKVCNKIDSKLLIAEERAQIGHERHIVDSGNKPSYWCSCTTVYALTKRLRKWSKSKK